MSRRIDSNKAKKGLLAANRPCFIEQQFPVAKVSMESYKERTAKQSQTLTGLGKWWGRKPLVLVRAALLGLLMPASDNPEKDREIFLKLMTMDREGLYLRKNKSIPGKRLVSELKNMPPSIQRRFLSFEGKKIKLKRLSRNERDELQDLVFDRLSYDEKLRYCDRPEQIGGLAVNAWDEINSYLDTNANSLQELIEELGVLRFGHRPLVGDAFCGGGSIPFEAARMGCNAYGSDLNPAAALLAWASLNIVGGDSEVLNEIQITQEKVLKEVDHQIVEWGIEQNSLGWRADAYLYCVEVIDPESGWLVPLIPNLVVSKKARAIAQMVPDERNRRYDIEIHENASEEEMQIAQENKTINNSRLIPPNGGPSTPIDVIRRDLRLWEKEDVVPRPSDAFQERLYCIRWVETYLDEEGREQTRHHYRSVTAEDMKREERAIELLRERFYEWQTKGYIPSRMIVPGDKTDEPVRTRGWTHWHHLFTVRQLLTLGLLAQQAEQYNQDPHNFVSILLGLARSSDYNSKLCRWHLRTIGDKSEQTFSNQSLNTLYNYAGRSTLAIDNSFLIKSKANPVMGSGIINVRDARNIEVECDIWITDPPYADAVNYHELSEYFLAWYDKQLPKIFPDWYTDSKRALAVQGNDKNFRKSMIDCYRRMTQKMPANGLQIVMFTHQDASVWADLTMILWAAGLRVTAAWTIATETDSALKQGNYVQGTVLLVLRKRIETEAVFLDEIMPLVEIEVRQQLDSMLALEDDSDPNFGDADYQLAAYAAALRVLTAQPIEEIDPAREIMREQSSGGTSPVERLIRNAVKIACDHLVPKQFDANLWKRLAPMERFYLKGLEVESHGEYRNGVYQELARGFGAADYTDLLASTQANETRLKSPSEMGKKALGGNFNSSLVRQCLFAIYQVTKSEEAQDGLNWLKTEIPDYWEQRERIIHILDYLGRLEHVQAMKRWRKDGRFATLLAGNVRNDHV